MQRLVVIFLITVVMLQSGIKAGFVAYYNLNKEYIANVLCENKDNVAMNCKGKCYLNKKIKEQEKADNKLASILKEIKDVNGYLTSSDLFSPKPSSFFLEGNTSEYLLKHYPLPLSCIFQPPC